MHELGIASDICRTVSDFSEGRRVESITVDVGILAGVAVEALDFCIREVARDMGLGEPEVTIRTVSATLLCACGHEYSVNDMLDGCPSCGGYQREVRRGMDIIVREVEIDKGH